MGEQQPVCADDDDEQIAKKTKSMVGKLLVMVNGYAADRNRLRSLVLFETRMSGKGVNPVSTVAYSDRPETELILFHRDKALAYEKLADEVNEIIATWKKSDEVLDKDGFATMKECLIKIKDIDALQMKHISALETLLASLTKEMGGQEALMARLAADAASLAQKATEIPTTMELKQRLALKYGCSIEEVDRVLGAKAIEAESPDG
jgi:hypothetical protein